MNITVIIDWKSITAIGVCAIGIVLSHKMNAEQAKEIIDNSIKVLGTVGIKTISD